jgi:hypothetical protein
MERSNCPRDVTARQEEREHRCLKSMFASTLTFGFRLKADVYSTLADEQLLTSDKFAGMRKLVAGRRTS